MALTPAQLLDELMGPNRNALPNEAKSELHWSDDNVCKRFLCGFCPSQLFTNTRSDLGPCEKIHDENLRQLYKKSKRNGKMQYEEDFLRYLQSIMADVERRIRRGHQRLSLNAKTKENKDISQEDEEKVMEISRDINALIPQVEELGSEGRVDEAQALTEQIDKLKEQRERIQAIKDPMSNQDKQMEVCETCGAFLIVGDAQSRVDDHLMGKQHMGYAKIKLTIEELLIKKDGENESRRNRDMDTRDRDGRRNRDNDRGRDRDRDRERERDRDRDQDRNRDRKDRRERYDKDNDRHRSSRHDDSDRRRRERDEYSRHKARSRSRERHGRSRHDERDRRRSRSPRRRSRSNSPRSK